MFHRKKKRGRDIKMKKEKKERTGLDEIISILHKTKTALDAIFTNTRRISEIAEELKEIKNIIKEDVVDEAKLLNSTPKAVQIQAVKNSVEELEKSKVNKIDIEKYVEKEINYRENYAKCEEECEGLIGTIETFCHPKDKYEVVKMWHAIMGTIKREYNIKKKTDNNNRYLDE